MSDASVDPAQIPEKMTREQLQWWILFTIAVAGKTAKTTEKKMREFMSLPPRYRLNQFGPRRLQSPFGVVRSMIAEGMLGRNLRKVKLGKYTLLNKGFRAACQLNLDALEQANPADALKMLTAVPGLGPKGARMIILYSRAEDVRLVPLDTHILKFLKSIGIYGVPKSTPSSKSLYHRLESEFIKEADRRGVTVRDLDTEVWQSYTVK